MQSIPTYLYAACEFVTESPLSTCWHPLFMPTTTNPKLKPALVSLVHHVHLNKSGWWKHAVERLVLVTYFGSSKGIAVKDARDAIVAARSGPGFLYSFTRSANWISGRG